MGFKGDNQIFADLKALSDGFISAMNYTGWLATQGYQPEQMGLRSRVIRFSTVYVRRVGFQGREYLPPSTPDSGSMAVSAMIRREKFREERSVQFDFFKKRLPTDGVDTVSAGDVARTFAAYIESEGGAAVLHSMGYGRLQIVNVRNEREIGDSAKFQLLPGFDLILQYDQFLDFGQPATETVESGIYGI